MGGQFEEIDPIKKVATYANSAGGETTLCRYFYAKWAKAANSNLPGTYFG